MDSLSDTFSGLQGLLFEQLLQPVMFATGLGHLLPDGFNAMGWLLVGLLQLLVMLTVIGPLQRWRPVEPVTDRATVGTDVIYTLIHRLGLFRVAVFFAVEPLLSALFGQWRVAGLATWHLDALWPGVTDLALVSLLLYLVVLDALNYLIHRGQHGLGWWWQLHALHHAQRQMTQWSDNRNHLLDDLIRDVLVVLVAQLIGIAPSQYVAIVALTQLSENLQHANLRLWFGPWGERLWVSPRFHRMHHAVGQEERQNCNFGVLLPWWDMLFRTANFELSYPTTGVLDQLEQGRDYGRGFWSQQWLGLKRLAGRA